VDFEPCDVTDPHYARGWDIIFRLQLRACGVEDGASRVAYEQAAAALKPCLCYETSLDAMPDYSVTRYLPPAGLGVATVIVLELMGATSVEVTYDD
jgi:hypothetical protein